MILVLPPQSQTIKNQQNFVVHLLDYFIDSHSISWLVLCLLLFYMQSFWYAFSWGFRWLKVWVKVVWVVRKGFQNFCDSYGCFPFDQFRYLREMERVLRFWRFWSLRKIGDKKVRSYKFKEGKGLVCNTIFWEVRSLYILGVVVWKDIGLFPKNLGNYGVWV